MREYVIPYHTRPDTPIVFNKYGTLCHIFPNYTFTPEPNTIVGWYMLCRMLERHTSVHVELQKECLVDSMIYSCLLHTRYSDEILMKLFGHPILYQFCGGSEFHTNVRIFHTQIGDTCVIISANKEGMLGILFGTKTNAKRDLTESMDCLFAIFEKIYWSIDRKKQIYECPYPSDRAGLEFVYDAMVQRGRP